MLFLIGFSAHCIGRTEKKIHFAYMNERKNNKGHDFVTAISMTKPKTFEREFSYYNVTVVCHGNHISNKKQSPGFTNFLCSPQSMMLLTTPLLHYVHIKT